MPKNIIGGSRMNHEHALNTTHVHEPEIDCYDLEDGDAMVFWDMGLPAVGNWWVLSSVTLGFSVQPVAPAMLWVDADTAADTYWFTYVGQTPATIDQTACCPSTAGPWKFNFDPAIKFPANTDFAVNYWGLDGGTTIAISWECWQENDICEV